LINDGNTQINGSTDINSFLAGGNGDDTITGAIRGRSTIRGGKGNDRLVGGFSDDLMVGGEGNDTLGSIVRADFGNDTLTGNGCNDSFILDEVSFPDFVITDFETGQDKILLATRTFDLFTPGDSSLEPSQFSIVDDDASAGSSNALITYSLETGNLFYNPDGAEEGLANGGKIVTLQGIPSLAETDFGFI